MISYVVVGDDGTDGRTRGTADGSRAMRGKVEIVWTCVEEQ